MALLSSGKRLCRRDRGALRGNIFFRFAAGPRQSRPVCLHGFVLAQAGEYGSQNAPASDVLGCLDPIVHPFAFAFCRDDPGMAQVGQVAGDFRLAFSGEVHQKIDTDFTSLHQVEQTEPSVVGQGPEEVLHSQWCYTDTHAERMDFSTHIG